MDSSGQTHHAVPHTFSEETKLCENASKAELSSSPICPSMCDIAAAAASTASMMWADACCDMLRASAAEEPVALPSRLELERR